MMNSIYFGLLAESGAANIPLDCVASKYFELSDEEARRHKTSLTDNAGPTGESEDRGQVDGEQMCAQVLGPWPRH